MNAPMLRFMSMVMVHEIEYQSFFETQRGKTYEILEWAEYVSDHR